MSSTLLTPNCDREEQATDVRQACLRRLQPNLPVLQTTFLGWMKLRNVGEVSQLKYSSDHAPLATLRNPIRKPGPTLSALIIPMAVCLSSKECVCAKSLWARGWLWSTAPLQYNETPPRLNPVRRSRLWPCPTMREPCSVCRDVNQGRDSPKS